MAAADIGNLRARMKIWLHTLKGRNPIFNEVGSVARTEEPISRAKATARLLAPGPSLATLERFDGLFVRLVLGDDCLEEALHACWLTLPGEDERLFGRERELLALFVISHVARSGIGT